jgi:hypothetical protein
MELSTTKCGLALGMTNQAVRDHIAAGRLLARRVGVRREYRVHVADLRAFAARYDYELNEDYLATVRV